MASFLLPQLRRHRPVMPLVRHDQHCFPCCTAAPSVSHFNAEEQSGKKKGTWLTLPPFMLSVDSASLGKEIERGRRPSTSTCSPTTALKWVRRCCPKLPVSLVQKLFRSRQVRREIVNEGETSCLNTLKPHHSTNRISGRELVRHGDVILLPITVQEFLMEKSEYHVSEDERKYICSLELYKDEEIIALNKPPGMPVQGGVGIKLSMDILAESCLKYDYSEPPRLVHRLDKESSGILLLGRTQMSVSALHSFFHEKTNGAFDEMKKSRRTFTKRYWALVIGTPKQSKGLITASLRKVALENGKSDRIMVANIEGEASSQHAVTEYAVIESCHGFTWLELCPLTGRKHQLRVHCAEVLGTPIVGDFKYGWSLHRKWQPVSPSDPTGNKRNASNNTSSLFGLDHGGGSIMTQKPRLHLHCRQMILPNVSLLLQHMRLPTVCRDYPENNFLKLIAPLPSHMQKSWNALNYCTEMIKTFGNTSVE